MKDVITTTDLALVFPLSSFISHLSSLIFHPSSFILHLSSFSVLFIELNQHITFTDILTHL